MEERHFLLGEEREIPSNNICIMKFRDQILLAFMNFENPTHAKPLCSVTLSPYCQNDMQKDMQNTCIYYQHVMQTEYAKRTA